MSALHRLSRAAGLEIQWRDVQGTPQTVADDTLRAVLGAVGYPAGSEAQIAESLAILQAEQSRQSPSLVTALVGQPVTLAGTPGKFRITLEGGGVLEGTAEASASGIQLPAIGAPGYHRLELADFTTTIAACPAQAYTLAAAWPGEKLWGLTVQLYALRRNHDGGIGDFSALEDFARRAAQAGAAAIGISPVHALFSADVTRYGPYAPSNRAALNVLHIAQDSSAPDSAGLVDWPAAAAAKLAALRVAFGRGYDRAGLQQFRAGAGRLREHHAVFEALSESLSAGHATALDWRHWPAAYQHPESPAVAQFIRDHAEKIAFHAWLQWQADAGLAAAQEAARAAGAKIGLIADLAVGTDHAGSASWSHQEEVLRGLEIGAPPDFINREGQGWGITAFAPRGLRRSGFAAFIAMLRHALRHAGGVRIDHVMGLARLWVIPQGFPATQGCYLAMPVDDLMRLITLESQRHKAVILGEDLGTLPHGFGAKLDAAGIAGLRIMWFERQGTAFTPPAQWTPSAVAMTTTHDLPTTAGWWQGRDIALREELHMQGDDAATRDTERAALWSAFQTSGATEAAQPPPQDGAAVTLAAAAHLGHAACQLALLPVEDALSLPNQPNLPGTVDQHPNWRRRLPGDAQTLFAREDFRARLRRLDETRRGAP